MNDNDRIRQGLLKLLLPVDEARGWGDVQVRAVRARRRRRTVQAVLLTSAIALVVGIGFGMNNWLVENSDAAAPDVTTTTVIEPVECLDSRLHRDDRAFLEQWTEIDASLRTERCVVAGVLGPEPQFILDGLGEEMPLHPGRLPEDARLPGGSITPAVEFYPIIHLGQVADTDTHEFFFWARQGEFGSPMPCFWDSSGGGCDGPGQPLASMVEHVGIVGGGYSYPWHDFEIIVPKAASVVALEVNGEPIAWQRPVARGSVFLLKTYPQTMMVTVYDQTGAVIDRYEEPPSGG